MSWIEYIKYNIREILYKRRYKDIHFHNHEYEILTDIHFTKKYGTYISSKKFLFLDKLLIPENIRPHLNIYKLIDKNRKIHYMIHDFDVYIKKRIFFETLQEIIDYVYNKETLIYMFENHPKESDNLFKHVTIDDKLKEEYSYITDADDLGLF